MRHFIIWSVMFKTPPLKNIGGVTENHRILVNIESHLNDKWFLNKDFGFNAYD